MGSLSGRLVAVTGATGNVGEAVCAALVAEGARVWAMDRSDDAVARLAARLGNAVRGGACDLRDASAVARSLDSAGAAWGLVHTVGGWRGGTLTEATPEDLDFLLDLNLKTTFHVVRAALARMRATGGGRIVAVGSLPAATGLGGGSAAAYVASKAAVIALLRAADEEGRSADVRANVLAPATLDTPQNRAAMPDVDPRGWVPLTAVASAAVDCLRPGSGVGGTVLMLPGA